MAPSGDRNWRDGGDVLEVARLQTGTGTEEHIAPLRNRKRGDNVLDVGPPWKRNRNRRSGGDVLDVDPSGRRNLCSRGPENPYYLASLAAALRASQALLTQDPRADSQTESPQK